MDSKPDRATELGRSEAVGDTRTAANQFVLEAALLASSLAAINMRDEKCRIAQKVENAFESYAELLRRRPSLRLTLKDDVALGQILQQIRSRLNYLKVWRIRPGQDPQNGSE